MRMAPGARKLALTAHVTASVGWLGAVTGFLVLAVVGLTSADDQSVRAAYLAMGLIARFVVVPASVASLATGLLQSLGTPWGLFRHYWILAKLLLNLLCSIVLLVHMQPITYMADAAVAMSLSPGDLVEVRTQLVFNAAAAVIALLAATTLGVYKPRGMTPYGWRKLREVEAAAR
jgi:hypothetical protein